MTKPRKYLLITNDLGPHAGGIENFLLGLLRTLPQSGISGEEIVIYTSREDGSPDFDARLNAELGVVVIRDKSKVLIPTPALNRRIEKVMREYGSTHLWFGAAAPLAYASRYLKKRGALRSVAISHGHEVWWSAIPPFSRIIKSIGKSSDVITHLGAYTHKAIRKAAGEKVTMVQLAPGIDCSHFTPGEKDPTLIAKHGLAGKKTIVVVGRLVRRKGQDMLIECMPEILAEVPNAHLLIVGVGGYEKKLKKLVSQMKLEENITFVGRVNYDQLPSYFRLGDVFAMPARNRYAGLEVEGLGIVYLEAGASGIAVVAGDSGGAPDAVRHEQTGYVVDGKSKKEISSRITYLLKNPEVASEMGKAGRLWALEYWRWELWAQKFAEILK